MSREAVGAGRSAAAGAVAKAVACSLWVMVGAGFTAASAGIMAARADDGVGRVEVCGDAQQVGEWIERLNARRVATAPCAANTPATLLRWEPRLATSAQTLAISLAHQGAVSHLDGAGRALALRLQAAGYRPAAAAENVAAGQPTFAEVLDAWTRSPAHCANLMSADVTEVGIACVRRDESPYRWFWVAQFGRPKDR